MMERNRISYLVLPALFAGSVLFSSAVGQIRPRDEEFKLDIPEHKIVETRFYRTLSASVTNDRFILEAGATVSAARAVITIRNATGRVRFKISNDAAALFRPRH